MTLLASFNHPVADAQHAFRRILKAMSEPGVMVSLPMQHGWGAISPAATSVLLTLVDRETPLWLDDALHDEVLLSNLRFHTGATVTDRHDAPFALLHAHSAIDPHCFAPGDDMTPEKSTTVIIEVPSLNGGLTLRLRGPGLMETRAIAPQLPERVVQALRERQQRFPQGIDLIFTCGQAMMALPRTTQVEVC
ncbi:alpha-D-ribose 1-methylphosphonate 5-triphosphate synthase subunit PhnH [Erwinia toletana]|uniref:Alpha-D-ribose 1-methylphosphonate 5-triphosphate synthase subunit PhnH n=1 Tax=Winslowiella toletana TaxID=92490 RepID=A0ABS4P3T2_9GAMM|nr:phosphonate C-P lyase system protein PhnH [Winslowiella toletana]MBP2167312.1 alpha-D-ribose 1-methylphosphonate 5-triphosphate synthase subunit PhnH [Winslowiella toletana]